MIVDPIEVLKKTTAIPTGTILPTTSSVHSSHFPQPTVFKPEYETASDTGTRTLWVVFVIMVIASVSFIGMAWTVPVQKRLFHTMTTLITLIAALSYFAMATGHGVSHKHIKYTDNEEHLGPIPREVVRDVYWQRYVDWSLTTPLLLLDLCFLAGVNGFTMLTVIVADLVMILTGLFAAYGDEENAQKWGWYTWGCIAYLVIVWHMALGGRAKAAAKSSKVGSFFASLAGFTFILWTAYPIIWGLAEGARTLSVDQEIIAYAVLDVLAKPVFGLWLLFTHSRLSEAHVELNGFWAHGAGNEGGIRIGDDEDGA